MPHTAVIDRRYSNRHCSGGLWPTGFDW